MSDAVVSDPVEVPGVDRSILTPVVRRVLGRQATEVVDWRTEVLQGGTGGVMGWSGVYRVTGEARDGERELSWSLILKSVLAPERGGDSHHAREALFYQSGILNALPEGLIAPRCLAVEEPEAGLCRIWLEDVHDELGARWPLERFGVVARHLGQFNGAYLTERPLPPCPWADPSLPRALADVVLSSGTRVRDLLDHPLTRHGFPPDAADATLRLWDEREVLLSALDRLPRTFCHQDAFRPNLLARLTPDGLDQTVAIDWAYAGPGAVGEDLASLVSADLYFGEVEMSQMVELDEIAFEGYVEGLRDAGWPGDARLARLGYTAAVSLRYGLLIPLTVFLPILLDEARVAAVDKMMGMPMADYLAQGAPHIRFLMDRADEARGLLPLVG